MTLRETKSTTPDIAVIIPNWNGADDLPKAVDSVLAQSLADLTLIVVDNGSTDNSKQIIKEYIEKDARVRAIWRDKNYGYTGGVNPGLELALDFGCVYAAPFNNDAAADKDWLRHLRDFLSAHDEYGIAACKLLHANGKTFDSTGDIYTSWGLPFPRGRDEPVSDKYDHQTEIFGASGGASMYRVAMLREIGLFDDDFFAYSEDIDISFRAQLAGWKVRFVPEAVVYHEQSATSNRMPSGFTTYQTLKNYPWVLWKNVPWRLFPTILPRFMLAYCMFISAALGRKQFGAVVTGICSFWVKFPKKLGQRRHIQQHRTVTIAYVRSIITWDLPPNARKLRAFRAKWHALFPRKKSA
jgi:GT2 family glycosyltransferase